MEISLKYQEVEEFSLQYKTVQHSNAQPTVLALKEERQRTPTKRGKTGPVLAL